MGLARKPSSQVRFYLSPHLWMQNQASSRLGSRSIGWIEYFVNIWTHSATTNIYICVSHHCYVEKHPKANRLQFTVFWKNVNKVTKPVFEFFQSLIANEFWVWTLISRPRFRWMMMMRDLSIHKEKRRKLRELFIANQDKNGNRVRK